MERGLIDKDVRLRLPDVCVSARSIANAIHCSVMVRTTSLRQIRPTTKKWEAGRRHESLSAWFTSLSHNNLQWLHWLVCVQKSYVVQIFTARAAMLARYKLPQFSLSVRLSVTRVLCDKTKHCISDILISLPHERPLTLHVVFWYQQWLVGDVPFRLKFELEATHPLRKTPTSTDFRL